MAANGPQWVRVIVGGLHTLAFRIDPAQSFAVVQQEFFGAALSRHLVFHKGSDLFVAVAVFKDTEREFIKRPRRLLMSFNLFFSPY